MVAADFMFFVRRVHGRITEEKFYLFSSETAREKERERERLRERTLHRTTDGSKLQRKDVLCY